MRTSTRWYLSFFVCFVVLSPVHTLAQANPPSEVPFPLLPGLENAVGFWKRIFTEYSLSQLVFFDPLDMSKIYEVLDVGEESRTQKFIDGERARIAAANGVNPDRVKAQRGIKERFAAGLTRSGRYMEMIQQIFRERGLPVDLGYLPLIESSFDINARSFVGAMGMWQFMRVTAKEFRLRIDRAIDERKDPLESTRAAAALLGQNYQALGNWPLALTAYNYGAAGIARAVAEVGSDNLVELIHKYNHRYWGFAPKNFYAEFLAAVDIAKNLNQHFPGLEFHPSYPIQEVELKNRSSLAAVLNTTGLSQAQFFQWNPALSSQTKFVPAGYRVKVPADGKAETIVEVQLRQPAQQPNMVHHRVKPGETIAHIARRYGASVQRILQVNRIHRPHLVRVGTTLLIPRA